MKHVVYECGICSGIHPWTWNGDCREDANRYPGLEEYAEKHRIPEADVIVRAWTERVAADQGVEF